MSAADLTTPTPSPSAPPPPRRSATGSRLSAVLTWFRVALVCSILLGSAAVRVWQAQRIDKELERGRVGPKIKLADLPYNFGPWKGTSTEIDPLIARATGADEIITRHYVNQDTGATLDAILLYGRAADMYTHQPEICYPAAGYSQVSRPELVKVNTGGTEVDFRSLVYGKGEGGTGELQEVYYTWRYNGRWTPQVGNQKQVERIPSIYKIHLARRITPGEKRNVGNPCESFLKELMPELERRLAGTQAPPS